MNVTARRWVTVVALLGLPWLQAGCDKEPNAGAKTEQSAAAPATEAESEPKGKVVPKDVKAFQEWLERAIPAITAGPEPTDSHATLGKITCQDDKEAPDFGYCGSSTTTIPRFGAQWQKDKPALWATNLVLEFAVSDVDCALLGKAELNKSDEKSILSFRCKYSETADIFLRHALPAGASRSTQAWVFSRDFPEQDEKAIHAPRASLYSKLNE